MGIGAAHDACRDHNVLETSALAADKDWFSRPGDSVLSAMSRRSVSPTALAEQLKGGMDQLRGIVAGTSAIDESAADALARAVGGSIRFWMDRQAKYESALAQAVQAVTNDDGDFWLKNVPLPDPKPRGKISEQVRSAELQKRLAFYGVSTITSWRARYGSEQKAARFRTSTSFMPSEGATSLWLRRGELEASLTSTQPWSPTGLKARLAEIRALSKISKVARFLPRLKKLLAEAGVALVIVKAPTGCRASGASRLIAANKAMILVSFRHRSDDQFWFTIFHEIGHLLLHDAAPFVDEDGMSEEDPCEQEANEFAVDLIVPDHRVSELYRLGDDAEMIRRFAVSLGVAPGLILGQLERRRLVDYGQFRKLRRIWTWQQIEG